MARAPLQAGDPARIGNYRLSARLGAGGMGVVYLGVAWDGSAIAVPPRGVGADAGQGRLHGASDRG